VKAIVIVLAVAAASPAAAQPLPGGFVLLRDVRSDHHPGHPLRPDRIIFVGPAAQRLRGRASAW